MNTTGLGPRPIITMLHHLGTKRIWPSCECSLASRVLFACVFFAEMEGNHAVDATSITDIPRLGFGTASLRDHHYETVKAALEMGYRLIDTASTRHPAYQASEVGRAIADAKVDRGDVIIETKSNPWAQGYKSTRLDVELSLKALQTDYIDIYIIHLPHCLTPNVCEGTWQDTWRAMEDLYEEGILRFLGVSNFNVPLLQQLMTIARIAPTIVQNRHDPLHLDHDVITWCNSQKAPIFYQSFSTLGRQWTATHPGRPNPVLTHPLIKQIAKEYSHKGSIVTEAQVVLKWALQSGIFVIPKSAHVGRIKSNLEVVQFDFELAAEHMQLMGNLDMQHEHEGKQNRNGHSQLSAGQKVELTLRNQSPIDVHIYWQESAQSGGRLVLVDTLKPGEGRKHSSWEGHHFVAKDTQGKLLREFRVQKPHEHIEL